MSAVWRLGWETRDGAAGVGRIERWADWAELDRAIAGGGVTPSAGSILAHHIAGTEPALGDNPLLELQWVRVNNGAGQSAADLLAESHLPVLTGRGAQWAALFEAVHGDDLPRFAVVVAWPSLELALDATLFIETDPQLLANAAHRRAEGRRPAILEMTRQFGFAARETGQRRTRSTAGQRRIPMRAERDELETVMAALKARFGDRLSRNRVVREQHANITSWHPVEPSDAVVFPETTEEVSEIVRACAEHGVPIIPFGVGSSLEGGVNAPFGGITIDLGRMASILKVNEDDMDCVVQAGVTRKQLNTHLRSTGLFFPIDPGADASLGGMASTRASGTCAVRYGTMRENVLGLTVVLPDGSVKKTGGRARKSAAGYDMTRLFVGAEGTLGVITELAVRLHGVPTAVAVAVCSFPDLRSACESVITTIRFGLPMARIELLDAVQVKACNQYSKLSMPEAPTLFVEFSGTELAIKEQVESFREIVAEFGCLAFEEASSAEERTRLWTARHDVYWACLALRPGSKFLATDVCVPISRLADCLLETHADIEETKLVAPIVGHVGDGNFHVSVMTDTSDAEEMTRTIAFIERLSLRAIGMDGTCTGEHGIGQGKRETLLKEHGETVDSMRMIKRAFDPRNIMNPGKIFLD